MQDATIWRTVRNARSLDAVSGNRDAAIGQAAKSLQLTADFIAERLHESAITLREAGVIATNVHWIEERLSGHWLVLTAPLGSRRQREGATVAGAMFFPSERFAYNARHALRFISVFDSPARLLIADAIRSALATNPPDYGGHIRVVIEDAKTPDGLSPSVGRFPNSVGLMLPEPGGRAWIGKDSYARWMADTLERGTVNAASSYDDMLGAWG